MKTLRRSKKIIQHTCLSVFIALFFVVSSSPPAKADVIKQGTVATTYGSYHWECFAGTTDSPISLGLNIIGVNLSFRSGSGFSLRYNFKDKYSGQITIGITTSNSWRYIDSYCTVNGGAFNSTPASASSYLTSHTFTINFEQCEYLEFTVYLDGVAYSNLFNSNTTISIAYGRTPVVDDKLTEIDTAIDLYLPGMNSSLSNIASNTSTMASDIAILKSYLDGLEGYVDNIEPYLNDLINISKIQSRPLYQQSALLWALSYSELNYDDLFPSFEYNTSNNNSAYTAINRLCIAPNSTYSLYIYTINQLGANSWNIYMRGSDAPITSTRTYSFAPPSTRYFLYRFDFINNSSAHVYFEIEFLNNVTIMPLFYGNKNNVPDDIHYLFGDELNNTYTRLLNQIATGIGNISQTQIIENNTNINNYNNYQQQINNVENNYYQQFNNYESNIENNNTFDFTGLSTDGVQVYNNLFSNVYGISLVKWPVLITLLGLVIVIILG